MPSVDLTIPSPVISGSSSFDVVIKDSSGATVFSGTEDNTTFTVSGLDPDNYTMYVTYGDTTNEWCFTVSPCECPVVTDSVITESGGIFFLKLTFDMSTYTPTFDCGFLVRITLDVGTNILLGISNLAGFVHEGGDLYSYTFNIGTYSSITYNIYTTSYYDGYRPIAECVPETPVSYACSGVFNTNSGGSAFPTVSLYNSSGDFILEIDYASCGNDCHTVIWNYLQVGGIAVGSSPDSGTFTDTVGCSPIGTTTRILTPAPSILSAPVKYKLTGTDCCGNVYSATVTCTCTLTVADMHFSSTIVNQLDITFTACGGGVGDCNEVLVSYYQTDVVSGFTPDSGSYTITIPCGGLPYVDHRIFTPAPSTHPTVSKYNMDFLNVCLGGAGSAAVGILK